MVNPILANAAFTTLPIVFFSPSLLPMLALICPDFNISPAHRLWNLSSFLSSGQ
jgi:hypothetical protein